MRQNMDYIVAKRGRVEIRTERRERKKEKRDIKYRRKRERKRWLNMSRFYLILFPCLFIWGSILTIGKVFHNTKSGLWEFCTDKFIGLFCLKELFGWGSMGHLNSKVQSLDFHLLLETGKCSLWYHHNMVPCIKVVITSISLFFIIMCFCFCVYV